tara:strand:+ start:627 stop:1598 length:972 start_codon:yes stop_codon:yes gene_type:complete
MANIISNPVSWNQEDARKYFLQPLFVSNNDMDWFDVMTDISGSSIKLDKYAAMKGITKALNDGCFDTNDNDVTSGNSQVTLTLNRLEVEHEQKAHALFNHIKSQMMKRGINRNDLTGTLLMEIVSDLLMGGIKRDFSTVLWWGETTGGSGVQGLANGVWEAVNGIPATQIVAYTGTALTDLASMMDNRTNELAASDQVMFVSRTFAEKYKAELFAIGVNNAYMDMQQGIANLSYQGIKMIVMPDWDVNIAEFGTSLPSNGPSAANKTECAMILAKDAIAVGTDWQIQDVDMWYNKDCKANRFRMNYSFGCALKDDSLAVTCCH